MRPISIEALLDWVMKEYRKTGTIFGIRQFYKADKSKKNILI